MTVHFIGAGPGAPDLITVRGLKLIKECPLVLYAGSLVPEAVVAEAAANAKVIDTASMNLDEILFEIEEAHTEGHDVARVHSGDPSIYGAIGEQMRRLDALSIPYDVTPGVSAYAAAAAEMKRELTLAGVSQSVILTRTAIRSSAMPNEEGLRTFAKSGATLAIHLSINNIVNVTRELTPYYGEDCPVAVCFRIGWPEQQIIEGTLADICAKVKSARFTRTALILVGRVLKPKEFDDSRLYSPSHHHLLRPLKN